MANLYFSVSLMKSMMKRREESEEVIVCIGDVMLERVRCSYTVHNFFIFRNKDRTWGKEQVNKVRAWTTGNHTRSSGMHSACTKPVRSNSVQKYR